MIKGEFAAVWNDNEPTQVWVEEEEGSTHEGSVQTLLVTIGGGDTVHIPIDDEGGVVVDQISVAVKDDSPDGFHFEHPGD